MHKRCFQKPRRQIRFLTDSVCFSVELLGIISHFHKQRQENQVWTELCFHTWCSTGDCMSLRCSHIVRKLTMQSMKEARQDTAEIILRHPDFVLGGLAG